VPCGLSDLAEPVDRTGAKDEVRREHRVPLSKPAVKFDIAVQRARPDDSVFPWLRWAARTLSLTATSRIDRSFIISLIRNILKAR